MSGERVEPCEDCGSSREPGQRYCLGCGARSGARSPQLLELLRRVNDRLNAEDAAAEGSLAAPRAASGAPRIPTPPPRPPRILAPIFALRLPPAKVSALLVLVFLGFGVLLGGAAGSRVSGSLAASARRLQVVLGQTATAAPPRSPSSLPARSEPPESESTPTPTASESPPSPTPTPKAPPASSGSSPAASNGGGGGSEPSPAGSASKLPPVKHVFVIMLSDQPYAAVFGPASPAPYLSRTLERRGALLVRYDAVAHEQLANEIALLSGQGPTAETAANCPSYADLAPATPAADEQLLGNGCVYPKRTQTLMGQLSAKHLTWRAYAEGIDEAGSQTAACAHPVFGQSDPTASQTPAPGTRYATFRNPFVYFHSVVDSPACAAGDVGLERLKPDLADAKRTPSFSYIAPDRCHDGSPTPCAPGAPAGLVAADAFLKGVVPAITGSKAYKHGGLLVITVDQAPSSGEFADSSSCCGQPAYANLVASATGSSPRGGGTVGALLLSPFIKGAATSQEPYNHFSLLRTIEDLFGLKHLGFAGLQRVAAFEPSIFSAYKPG